MQVPKWTLKQANLPHGGVREWQPSSCNRQDDRPRMAIMDVHAVYTNPDGTRTCPVDFALPSQTDLSLSWYAKSIYVQRTQDCAHLK